MPSPNNYIVSGGFQSETNVAASVYGGIVLSGTLDRIRLTTVNGTDSYDSGSVSLLLEG